MLSRNLVGALVLLSFASGASAQTTAAKPKQTKKAPAAAKSAPKTAEPAPAAVPTPPSPPSDVEIHTRYVTGAQVSENKTYIKGARQRFEFPGITMISQCDLKRSLQIHDATKHYLVVAHEVPLQPPAASIAATPESDMAAQMAAMSSAAGRGNALPKPQGGVINETITLTDTGERKQIFGLEARHIKTVVTRRPGPNACDTRATTLETEGWYADLPDQTSCPNLPAQPAPSARVGQQACTDQIVTQESGSAALGFALSTVVTTTVVDSTANEKDQEKDKDVTTMSMEVTALKVTSLDTALFDVPPDYTEVKDYGALLPSLGAGGSLSDAVFGSISDGTSTVAEKKAGVIRVGVVTPTNRSGKDMPDLRLVGSLLSGFTKQPFEALPVYGATAADLDRDAASKRCDYVLASDIAELKTSRPNKVGGLLKKVSGDVSGPSEIHEVRVDYKLYAVGDPVKPKVASSVKASSGGGFGFGSALRLAYFAGSMYMTMGMGLGNMMGMMGPSSALGGIGGGMMGTRMNPAMGAAMSIMSTGGSMGLMGGMPGGTSASDPSGQRAIETVQEGLAKAGKQAGEELKRAKLSAERK